MGPPWSAEPRGPVSTYEPRFEAPRLWSIVFTVRHVAIVAFATIFALHPAFGDDRLGLAGLTLAVLLYDVPVHLYARRRRRLPQHMLVVLAVVPPLIALAYPQGWIPAIAASIANLGLFAVTFPLWKALVATALAALTFAAVAVVAEPLAAVEGVVSFAISAPALVIGVAALFEAHRTAERLYAELVENANDIIYTHDVETMAFTSVNQAALDATGYSRDEIRDLTVADIVAPEDVERAARMVARKIEGDADATTYDIEILAKDGRRIPVEVSTRAIRQRGEPVAIQGIARDISERRQVERQRAALEHARSEFIANAAHELRTPLTTLAGLASVLASTRDRMSEEEIQGAIDALDRQGRRARLLADRLLDFSSIELGRLPMACEPVRVGEVIERAVESAPPPVDRQLDVSVDSDLKVLADALALQEIVANLVTNAYRYGGPTIRVGAERDDGRVVLTVSDDGPGVPEELTADLFEPFTRSHGRPESTGLGLAICARLAEGLGGSIDYRPGDPTGAVFEVRLTAAR